MVTKCLQQSQSCHLISSMFLGKAKYRALIQNVVLWSFSSPCWHLQVLSRLFLSASVSVSPLFYLWFLLLFVLPVEPYFRVLAFALHTWGNHPPVSHDLISLRQWLAPEVICWPLCFEETYCVFPCVQTPCSAASLHELRVYWPEERWMLWMPAPFKNPGSPFPISFGLYLKIFSKDYFEPFIKWVRAQMKLFGMTHKPAEL